MSPNPGAEEEELKFSEGDLIKIFGEKDEDGFYWGECEGVTGFVPYNMVSEVQVEDDDLANQAPSSLPQAYEPSLPQDNSSYYPREETSTQKMIALFDYDPRILSPNPDSEVELSFHVGDVVLVYGEMDEDGFFTGELNGLRGLVPSNFLEDL
ncbi:predicted protein, partial [Nematostella vectensis]